MGIVINDAQNAQVRADERAAHEVKMWNADKLRELRDKICKEITDELDLIMEQVKQTAIELCPKDTGALASSISLEGGAISEGNDFYYASIYAGSPDIVNPKTGKGTDEYALYVEEGHMIGNTFWEGSHFLEQAMMMFEGELEAAVSRALAELAGD